MDDLISRQAAIDVVYAYMNDCGIIDRNWHANGIVRDIEKLPSAQPERKKGKWINRHYIFSYRYVDTKVCSNCLYEYSYDAETGITEANFCPNCGADMREETEDV